MSINVSNARPALHQPERDLHLRPQPATYLRRESQIATMMLRSGLQTGPGDRQGQRQEVTETQTGKMNSQAEILVANVSGLSQRIYYSQHPIQTDDVDYEDIPTQKFVIFSSNGPVYIKVNDLESKGYTLTAERSLVCTEEGQFPLKKKQKM
ncbi:hypothetical protein GJAV_G00090310 [Gymnothorax javanicus]|nr:hypothetical protein GJAV_G00090310 [Gymnothorax javanicus]